LTPWTYRWITGGCGSWSEILSQAGQPSVRRRPVAETCDARAGRRVSTKVQNVARATKLFKLFESLHGFDILFFSLLHRQLLR
jgi:hypothetical protein